mmetsp:Transcript_1575/g.2105  ORF Transcript_1575/g.2105 Transcript_1575/m.2105 type:complete len:119 (+) Transcript_1575:878-1234(+)
MAPFIQYQTPENLVEQLTFKEVESEEEKDSRLAHYADFLLQQSFLFVPVFYNTFLAVIALRKPWKKVVFALSTFLAALGAVLNHFPSDVFKSKEAVIKILLIMGTTIFLTIIFAVSAI